VIAEGLIVLKQLREQQKCGRSGLSAAVRDFSTTLFYVTLGIAGAAKQERVKMSFISHTRMSLFDEPSRHPLPRPGLEDVRFAAGKGLVSTIPLVGGAGSELIGLLSSPVAQRRDDWLEDLQRRLHWLEGTVEGFRFEDLGQNEQFVSASLRAIQAAVKTHRKEKLEALRNAVLNIALKREPNEDRQALFFALIERYEPIHMQILGFFKDPQRYGFKRPEGIKGKHMAIYNAVIDSLPEINAHFDQAKSEEESAAAGQLLQLIIEDLVNDKLVGIKGPFDKIPNFPTPHWTTGLGNAFLDFITSDIGRQQR
jgi:hypothetical protein